MTQLEAHLRDIGEDASVRSVILSGAGPVFCSGHDLKEIVPEPSVIKAETPEMKQARARRLFGLFSQCSSLMLALRQLPQPVIAQVHGIATAAGLQLVASCDLAYATKDTLFATPGVSIN
jgi:enoyl-CoA hydratase/carnithine racemase